MSRVSRKQRTPRRAGLVRRQRAVAARATRPLKIVVTGPFAAGKTTFIKTISEVAVVGTERGVSDDGRHVKGATTVALDFGRISFAEDLSLFLFGTPGQRRFEVMWEILSEGMIGFVALVNAADDRSIEEAGVIVEQFRRYADVPWVVGITHADEADAPSEAIAERVAQRLSVPPGVPIVECDPRDRDSVKDLLLQVLIGVLTRLDSADRAAG